MLALAKALYRADLDAALAGDGTSLPLLHLADVQAHEPRTRSNDGRADRHGNFVFGTMDESAAKTPVGAFYQYSATHGLRPLPLPGAAIPNSICFSPDGRTLYWCDSVQSTLQCCDYDPGAAQVGPSRVFAEDSAAIMAGGFALLAFIHDWPEKTSPQRTFETSHLMCFATLILLVPAIGLLAAGATFLAIFLAGPARASWKMVFVSVAIVFAMQWMLVGELLERHLDFGWSTPLFRMTGF